jgi:membrane-bound serine protease (ClpP class)
MEFSLDPNLAYLILVIATILAVLALLSPGSGFIEIGAVIAALFAAYSIYRLPLSGIALAILSVGGILFLVAFFRKDRRWILGSSILCLIIGSAFLFRSEHWWQPAVNPLLAILVSAATGSFFWVIGRKLLEASVATPHHDPDRLIGELGEAKTDIHQHGSVQVDGELWSATSHTPIPAGSLVRVVKRDGFTLEVVKEEQN